MHRLTSFAIVMASSLCVSTGAAAREVKLLVVYETRTGNTERLARAVADGASESELATATLRGVGDVDEEEIRAADGIVLGTPVHWGSLSASAKSFLDRVGDVLSRAGEIGSEAKPGVARLRTAGTFVTGGAVSSGKDLARLAVLAGFLNMRFVVVGGEDQDGFGTLGPQATTGEADDEPGVSEDELAEARRFGARFAAVTEAIRR